jgi:1,4-dihydroxy-2-naphthoate octaprenyltransferase
MSATAPSSPAESRPSSLKVWLAAARPQTLTAGAVPVGVGTALAAADGALHVPSALAALGGAVAIQLGTNFFNDYEDFKRGADTDERLGPARATQRGWLTPRQVGVATAVAFLVAALFGLYLIDRGGLPILVLGVVSVLCGLAYTGGPMPLAYHGLGDLFVIVFFGVAAVAGTYYVQALSVTPTAVLLGVAVGALATCILVVNNLRDRGTDAKAGKRTLAVRYGAGFARAEYAAMLALAYAVPVSQVVSGRAGPAWLLPLLSLPLALRELVAIHRKDGAALNPHLGGAARVGVLYGALLSLGVLL